MFIRWQILQHSRVSEIRQTLWKNTERVHLVHCLIRN